MEEDRPSRGKNNRIRRYDGSPTRRTSLSRYDSFISPKTRPATVFSTQKVRKSLTENDLTVVSIFVNPAQFAPHEDLETYPRTLRTDVTLLETLDDGTRKPSAIFAPSVNEMYPSGLAQNVAEQKGTFVEVQGYGHQMEGSSRPTFFRGVATVVTKLFNIIQVNPKKSFLWNRIAFFYFPCPA